MIFKPYERRIVKYTRNDGSKFFQIEFYLNQHWFELTGKKFKTFVAAVLWARAYDLSQVVSVNTVCKF